MLVINGMRDTQVPVEDVFLLMRSGSPKEVWINPQGGHMGRNVAISDQKIFETVTLPWVVVGFRGPAYSDTNKDKAALDLLASIAFGENSELYQRLVIKEQKVDNLGPDFADRVDPEIFSVWARVKKPEDMDYVRDQILATYKRYTTEMIPQAKLDAAGSRMRYSFALSMNSSDAIADSLAPYISLRRTPQTIDKLYALYESITPEDVRAAAARYFVEKNRTIVTLSTKMDDKGGMK